MSCKECIKQQEEPGIAWYRWKIANVAMKGCDKHLREIFDVLTKHQREQNGRTGISIGISIGALTKADIGRYVEYTSHNTTKKGRIKSFNDSWIFVVFHCDNQWDNYKDYIAAACSPKNLTF